MYPTSLRLLLPLLAFLCVASTAIAQPANDDFADASVLSGFPAAGAGETNFATKETGEPDHERSAPEAGGASVWWVWTAPASQRVLVDVCDNTIFDPQVSIYTGSAVNALTRVPTVLHGECGIGQARIIDVVAGTTYHIAVAGTLSFGVPRMGSFNIAIRPPADNDDFADAAIIPGESGIVTGLDLLATKEAGEPDHSGSGLGGTSVWWRWTAPFSGLVRASTCDSQGNTFLAVYTGAAVNALTPVAQNDDACGQRAALTFTAVMGTTYSIAVDSEDFVTSLVLRLGAPPPNDAFAAAEALAGAPATANAVNGLAATEANEPTPTAGTTVWWHWTAPSTGKFTIDTCDSDFDTRLAVFTGTQLNALTPVGNSDDGCGSQSQVTIDATAGTDYKIQVGGYLNDSLRDTAVQPPAASGTIALRISAGPGAPPTGAPGTVDFGVAAGSPITGSGKSTSSGIGDFNEDGTPDIVRVSDGKIEILLGDGHCGFTPASKTITLPNFSGAAVAVGLLNGDAHRDLVVAQTNFFPAPPGGALSVYLGNGTGGFTKHADSPIEESFGFFAPSIGNVDTDPANDVLVTTGENVDIELYRNDGTGHLTHFPAGALTANAPAPLFALANLDDAGALDVVVGDALVCCSGTASSFNLYRSVGDGTFQGKGGLTTQYSDDNLTADRVPTFATGDLDGNGTTDIVVTDVATHVILTDGAFGTSRAPGGTLKAYAGAILVDVDGDHDLDIVGSTLEGLYVLLNDGHAGFAVAKTSPEPYPITGSTTALDCDGDQDQDLALVTTATGSVTILENGGGGAPPGPTPSPTATPVATRTPAPEAPDHCDDCIDNDFDGDVDRGDADCPTRADGAGATVSGGKAVLKCQKAIEKAGSGLTQKRVKALGGCVQKAFACVQDGSDAKCLAKAGAGCAKVESARPAVLAKLTAAIAKACETPPLGADDLTTAAGLGFAAEASSCAAFGVPSLGSPADVAACLAARDACRAEALVGAQVPRARALLTLAGRDPSVDAPCLPYGGTGGAAVDPKRTLKCQKGLAKAGAGYASVRAKTQQKCVDTQLACMQLQASAPACLAKATTACTKQAAKVTAAAAKLTAALTKACGDLTTVLDANGVGFELRSAECTALASPATSLASVASCLVAQHDCRVDQVTLGAAPRANEVGALVP